MRLLKAFILSSKIFWSFLLSVSLVPWKKYLTRYSSIQFELFSVLSSRSLSTERWTYKQRSNIPICQWSNLNGHKRMFTILAGLFLNCLLYTHNRRNEDANTDIHINHKNFRHCHAKCFGTWLMLHRWTPGKKRLCKGAVVSLIVVIGRELRYADRFITNKKMAVIVEQRIMKLQSSVETIPCCNRYW